MEPGKMNVGSKTATPRRRFGGPSNSSAGFFRAFVVNFGQRFAALMDRLVPGEFLADPEQTRRARLITRFGVLGSLFGLTYATFYLLIGHEWGSAIILTCSSGVAATP